MFPWHWAQVSLPILQISMTLSVHCHKCPFAVPPLVSSLIPWCVSGCCGDGHRVPFPCPFSDLLSNPIFSKRNTGKGPISKGCLGCGVSGMRRVKLLEKGFVEFWRQHEGSISFPWACSFWAHTLIYTGIFLSLSVLLLCFIIPVFISLHT